MNKTKDRAYKANIKKGKKLTDALVVFAVIAATILIAVIVNNQDYHKYASGSTGVSIDYERARVLTIIEEELKESAHQAGIMAGTQTIEMEILSGEHKGEIVTARNALSTYNSIVAKKGQTLIVVYDALDSGEYSVYVYNYYRAPYIYILTAIFFGLLVIIGRKKGVMSGLGLIYTFICVLFVFLPLIVRGYSPIWSSIAMAVMVTMASMLFLNGPCKKSLCAITGTICGVVLSGLILFTFNSLMHISGFNTDEAESLMLIGQTTGLQVKDLLFAGILIASLGAVMDVAMSIVSSMYEIGANMQKLSRFELFKAGINVGKDMIGTMSNTLILAFAGSSLNLMILMFSYSVQFNQLMNMNLICIEIVQALSGSLAIILTVPLTALITARLMAEKGR